MRRILLCLALLTLALSACELRAEIEVNDNGSGTFGFVFGADPQMRGFLAQAGEDPFAELRRDLADDPVPWTVTEFAEGDLTGVRATFPFDSVEQMKSALEALDQDPSNNGAAFRDFRLERSGEDWVFHASSDLQSSFGADAPPIPVEQLATLLRLQFRVTLPGKAASHNADEVTRSGGRTTFIWKPTLSATAVSMDARTTPGGGSLPVVPIAAGVLALVAVLAAVSLVRRSGAPPAPVIEGFPVPALPEALDGAGSAGSPEAPGEHVAQG